MSPFGLGLFLTCKTLLIFWNTQYGPKMTSWQSTTAFLHPAQALYPHLMRWKRFLFKSVKGVLLWFMPCLLLLTFNELSICWPVMSQMEVIFSEPTIWLEDCGFLRTSFCSNLVSTCFIMSVLVFNQSIIIVWIHWSQFSANNIILFKCWINTLRIFTYCQIFWKIFILIKSWW